MKPARVIVLWLVLIGVVANLAIAWSCALWWPVTTDSEFEVSRDLPPDLAASPEVTSWARGTNPGAALLFYRATSTGLGIEMDSIGAREEIALAKPVGPERVRRGHRAGWPFASMSCEGYLDWTMHPKSTFPAPPDWRGGVAVPSWVRPGESGPERSFFVIPRPLPLRMVPLGFAADTALYTGVAGAILLGPGAVRRIWRARRGLCPDCAYPVASLARCPECGRSAW